MYKSVFEIQNMEKLLGQLTVDAVPSIIGNIYDERYLWVLNGKNL